ncbi:MAG: cytochrome c biogenesis protein CcsA, partial [Verrucomicrobia bacterium]|nr:cytochrome c biogenesis protein CcsA [Verrucomicrobiota bacterium]
GVFTAPLVLVFQIIGLLGLFLEAEPGLSSGSAKEVDGWLELHASVSLVSFGAFALAGVAGLMFLVQNRQLKRHQLKALFYNLPPISYLTIAVFRLMGIGLILLTVGSISALLMKNAPIPLHQGLSIITWLAYASLLILQVTNRIGNIRLAQGAMAAFLLPVITLLLL